MSSTKKEPPIVPDKLLEVVPDYLKKLFINKLKLHKAKTSARIITMVQNELQILSNASTSEETKKMRKDIDELISQNEEQLTHINIFTLKIEKTSSYIKDDFQYLNFYLENIQTGIDTQIYDYYYSKYLSKKIPYDNNYRSTENEATKERPKLLERIQLVTNIKKQNDIEKQLSDIKSQKINLINQISNCSEAKYSIDSGNGFVQEDQSSLRVAKRNLEKNERFLEKEKERLEKLTEALKKEKNLLQKDESLKDRVQMGVLIIILVISLVFSYNMRKKYNIYYYKYEDLRKKYNSLVRQ